MLFSRSVVSSWLAACLLVALGFIVCTGSKNDIEAGEHSSELIADPVAILPRVLLKEEEQKLPSSLELIQDAIDKHRAAIHAAHAMLDLNVRPSLQVVHDYFHDRHSKARGIALTEAACDDYRHKVKASEAFLWKLRIQERKLKKESKSLEAAGEFYESQKAKMLSEYTGQVADAISKPPHEWLPNIEHTKRLSDRQKYALFSQLLQSDLCLSMLKTNAYDVAVLNHEPTFDDV